MTESVKVNLTEVKEAVASLGDAYKEPSVKVLDPDAISGSLLERMPNPTGWRILVLPYRGKGKTEGGIFLPDSAVEQKRLYNNDIEQKEKSYGEKSHQGFE